MWFVTVQPRRHALLPPLQPRSGATAVPSSAGPVLRVVRRPLPRRVIATPVRLVGVLVLLDHRQRRASRLFSTISPGSTVWILSGRRAIRHRDDAYGGHRLLRRGVQPGGTGEVCAYGVRGMRHRLDVRAVDQRRFPRVMFRRSPLGRLGQFRSEPNRGFVRRALLTAAGLVAPSHGVDPSVLLQRRCGRSWAIISHTARKCCIAIASC